MAEKQYEDQVVAEETQATQQTTIASEVTTIDDSLAALASDVDELTADRMGGGKGVAKSPFTARNGTAIGDTTYQEIKAAVAGKRHWIHWMEVVNITAAQSPAINVAEDTGGTPVVKHTTVPGDPASVPSRLLHFNPPIEITAGKNIGAQATTATGDTHVTIGGFVED